MTTPRFNPTLSQAHIESDDADQMSLERVSATGSIDGLLLTMTVTQTYRNRTAHSLEAVYTFPLAFGAVLLGVSALIGGRRMRGTVMKQQEAQQSYETAIASGDAPVLVEKSADDLYTANLGNLKPGEEALIELRYAQLLRQAQDRVQVRVPTTIAPRYGSATAAGLRSHESVESSLAVSYPFELQIEITGSLSAGEVSSPSHRIAVARTAQGVSARLAQRSWLDRDFVLELIQTAETPLRGQALVSPSGTGCVVLASFCSPLTHAPRRAIDLKILIDCSGSMAGDSITQSRIALHQVLSELNSVDQFTLSRFGSTTAHDFKRLTPADDTAVARAARVLKQTDANLGGTELPAALAEVIAIRGARDRADILLITDGDIWDIESVIKQVRHANHRIFAIGVGSAPAESLLRQLAEGTGGACELVSPNEDMQAAVMRMLTRIRSHRAEGLTVDWGFKPAWVTQLPLSLFEGDTIHVFAGFNEPVQDIHATLIYRLASDAQSSAGKRRPITSESVNPPEFAECRLTAKGQQAHSERIGTMQDDLPRMAAWQRITDAAERIQQRDSAREWAIGLALEHQLVTPDTSLFMVHEREASEKTNGQPRLQQITHMQAAGWGGIGSVTHIEHDLSADISGTPLMTNERFLVDCYDDAEWSDDDVGLTPIGLPGTTPELTINALLVQIDDMLFEPEYLDEPEWIWDGFQMPDRLLTVLDALIDLGLSRRQAWAFLLQEVIIRFARKELPGAVSVGIIASIVATIPAPINPRATKLVDTLLAHATLNTW